MRFRRHTCAVARQDDLAPTLANGLQHGDGALEQLRGKRPEKLGEMAKVPPGTGDPERPLAPGIAVASEGILAQENRRRQRVRGLVIDEPFDLGLRFSQEM